MALSFTTGAITHLELMVQEALRHPVMYRIEYSEDECLFTKARDVMLAHHKAHVICFAELSFAYEGSDRTLWLTEDELLEGIDLEQDLLSCLEEICLDAPAHNHRTDQHDAHVWDYRLGNHDVPF